MRRARTAVLTSVAVAIACTVTLPEPSAAQSDDDRIRAIVRRIEKIDGSQRVTTTTTTTSVTLAADVFFEFDQATLTPAAAAVLDGFAGEIAAVASGPVTIIGHTDAIGDADYNQGLSDARAESVRAYLAERLGPTFGLTAIGRGESEPVAPNQNDDGSDNPEGRARNRRVEFSYATA